MPTTNAHPGLIDALMAAVQREEKLIEDLIAAVKSGEKDEIIAAARAVAANRHQESP